MGHNSKLNTEIIAQDQELGLVSSIEDDGVPLSMWDSEDDKDIENELKTHWEGRQETHQMFLRSYD
jgi:hypothetical protein